MSNLFASFKGWFAGELKKAAGVSIVYSRSGQSSLSISAAAGKSEFPSEQFDAVRVERSDRDYLIAAADLTYGEPLLNDRITEIIDGVSRTYEVRLPIESVSDKPWRWADPQHSIYRIHCKRIS